MNYSSGIIICIVGLLVNPTSSSSIAFWSKADAKFYSASANNLHASLLKDATLPENISKFTEADPILARLRVLAKDLCLKSENCIESYKEILKGMEELSLALSHNTLKAADTIKYGLIRTEGLEQTRGENSNLVKKVGHLKQALGNLGIASIILNTGFGYAEIKEELNFAEKALLKINLADETEIETVTKRLNTLYSELWHLAKHQPEILGKPLDTLSVEEETTNGPLRNSFSALISASEIRI